MLSMNEKRLHNKVMWYNYVKSMQILKKFANIFFYWIKILGKKFGGQVLQKSHSKDAIWRIIL